MMMSISFVERVAPYAVTAIPPQTAYGMLAPRSVA
jgi:hypothetical protein